MAITINGSGTIGGLSAGGLPDGSVTAGDLASTLDLTGKTVTLPSGTGGKLLKVTQAFSSTTRTVYGNNQGNNIASENFLYPTGAALSVPFTKDQASSNIIITYSMAIGSSFQQHVGMLWNPTAGIYRRVGFDGGRNGNGTPSSDMVSGSAFISGLSAGSHTFYWTLGRSNDGNNTGWILNPNTNDAADKSGATYSEILVYEISA